MARIFLALTAVLWLGGCVSGAQRAANQCNQMGYFQGSEEFLSCVTQEQALAAQEDAVNRAAYGQMMGLGYQMTRPPIQPGPTFVVQPSY